MQNEKQENQASVNQKPFNVIDSLSKRKLLLGQNVYDMKHGRGAHSDLTDEELLTLGEQEFKRQKAKHDKTRQYIGFNRMPKVYRDHLQDYMRRTLYLDEEDGKPFDQVALDAGVLGVTMPGMYTYYPTKPNQDVRHDEETHSLSPKPQIEAIKRIVPLSKFYMDLPYEVQYQYNPSEIYSHFSILKGAMNFDPEHKYTRKEVRQLREQFSKDGKDERFNIFNTLSNRQIRKILNEVAYNPTQPTENVHYAKQGMKFSYFDFFGNR